MTYSISSHTTGRSCPDRISFAFIASNIYFTHKILRIVDPLLFPFLLSEVFKFQTWMKDWFDCQCSNTK